MAQDQSNIKTGQVCKTRQTESELSQYNLFIADTKVNDSKKSDYLARYKYFFQKFLMVPLLLNLEIKWVSQPMHTDTGGVGNIPNRSTLPVFYLILYLQLSSSRNLKHSIVVHVTSQDLTLNMKSGNQVKKEAMLELGTHKRSQHVSWSQFVRPMPLQSSKILDR